MPRGVIFNSLGLYVGSCRKLVIIIIFRTRNEHKFTLWTISQTNVSSFRLNSLFKASSFARDPRNVIWFEAISPFIKLNNDGSSLGNPGPSSFRGIMRDSHGLWLSGFYGHTTNMHAELFAILNEMHHTWNNKFRHIIIEINFLASIHLVE